MQVLPIHKEQKKMNVRAIAILALLASAPFQGSQAQQAEVIRFDVVRSDLSISGKEVVQVRVDFGPGACAKS